MSIEFKDCFLHFLDRELLETQGAYNRVIEESISRDVRFILLNSPGDLILSASFLFESKYAYAIFEEFYNFFVEGKFVIAITYDSIIKMVSAKQEQYKGKASLFPNYFNNFLNYFRNVFVTKQLRWNVSVPCGAAQAIFLYSSI